MTRPIAILASLKSAIRQLQTGVLAIAIALVFMAVPFDDANAKRKKYSKYKKHQKAYHRKNRRIRRRTRPRIIRANPELAKARVELKIGAKYFKALKKFYAARGHKKAWYTGISLNHNGSVLIEKLNLVHLDGLNQSEFKLPSKQFPKSGLLDDIKISFSLIRYGEQVQAGRLKPRRIVAQHDLKPKHPDLVALLKQAARAKNLTAVLDQLPPPHAQYHLLKARLADLRTKRKSAAQKALHLDVALQNAVKKASLVREDMIIANMERWRWVPRQLGEKHVWVNLPTYQLQIKEMGNISFATKGIIGKVDAPTPLISSKVKNIIVNPFWHIPASVVASEILPKLQSSQNDYLQTRGIKVLRRGGRIVDPQSVEWAKITNPRTYRFRQSPGKKNALGRVKILFPNSHSIYLHDTNEPELFAKSSRALSHGCIRLANPIGFADAIASYDDHLHSQMPGTLLGPRERWLKYKATLSVHLVYFTAEINAKGKLVTHPDIYRYDEKTTAVFKGQTPSS